MDRAELIAQGRRLATEYIENANPVNGGCVQEINLDKMLEKDSTESIKEMAHQILQNATDDLEANLPG